MTIDLSQQFATAEHLEALTCSPHINGLKGSSILAIAQEVRKLRAEGKQIFNLTIGDFNPSIFPIPSALRDAVKEEYDAGQTNYPPAVGVPELRQGVVDLYERELGLRYPIDSVIAGSGARPPIFATFAALLAPGDKVVYPVPSWNVNHYVYLNRAEGVQVVTSPDTGFMPTAAQLQPHLHDARLVVINSPQNPSGAVVSEDVLSEVCDAILAENARRAPLGERPLMLLFDAVYWQLTFGEYKHHTPMSLRPEMANYTIMVDAISKWWSGTGVRVGWCVAPPWLTKRMKALIGHMGAWAGRPEQLAVGRLLSNPEPLGDFLGHFSRQVQARLNLLARGIEDMANDGLPISSLEAQGAIYLSVKLDLMGHTTPEGKLLEDDEDVRSYLLNEAGVAVVPFTAFGYPAHSGWVRVSVGTVTMEDVEATLARLRTLLTPFKRP